MIIMKSLLKSRSVIYVNFAPYENTGNIRDYLLETHELTAVFIFNFHRLTKLDQPSTLTVYRRGRPIYRTRLFQTPTMPSLAFILLPVRSLVIFAQIIFHTLRLRCKGYMFDDFFTVNAFIAWTGIILKKLGLVRRTLFWVWDYYPPIHKSKMVMFMRWMYWQFDKPATYGSDKTIYLNNKMVDIRKKLGVLRRDTHPVIVPIGTNPIKRTLRHNPFSFIFLGVMKKSQGLDLWFESLPYLRKLSDAFTLHIVGGGPDEEYFKDRARSAVFPVFFHGYQSNDRVVDTLIGRGGIGIATYVPDPSNVSYWGDPSKIKRYISTGIPVITTDVFEFSGNITRSNSGIVIAYNPAEFARAVKTIIHNYLYYQSNAEKLSRKHRYEVIYKKMFA